MAMLTPREAAERLGCKPSTLRYWRMLHTGPAFHIFSARNIKYSESDVDAYVKARRYDPSARAALEEQIAHR